MDFNEDIFEFIEEILFVTDLEKMLNDNEIKYNVDYIKLIT